MSSTHWHILTSTVIKLWVTHIQHQWSHSRDVIPKTVKHAMNLCVSQHFFVFMWWISYFTLKYIKLWCCNCCHTPNVMIVQSVIFCSNVNITFTDQTGSVPLSIQTTDGWILSSLPLKSLPAAVQEFTAVVCDSWGEPVGVEDWRRRPAIDHYTNTETGPLLKGVVHFWKFFADNLLTPMSSKMSMSFFLQSKRN